MHPIEEARFRIVLALLSAGQDHLTAISSARAAVEFIFDLKPDPAPSASKAYALSGPPEATAATHSS